MKAHNAKKYLRAAVLLAVAVYGGHIPTQAQTLTTIWSFTGSNGDGEYPYPHGHLVFDSNGAMYGTTAGGGTSYNGGGTPQACGGGCGVVFKLTPPGVAGGAWTQSVLYAFQGVFDGQAPGQVVFGPNARYTVRLLLADLLLVPVGGLAAAPSFS